MPKVQDISVMFPEHTRVIERLRPDDDAFAELRDHLETRTRAQALRVGSVDQATIDLISSFDELRRDVERHVYRAAKR